jgi:UDP-glucose 4-epimerase
MSFKIAVTGGSGFIGSHIVSALEKSNHEVFVIDKINSINHKNYFAIDINDTSTLENFFKEKSIDYVYHIAAVANARRSVEDVLETVDVNIRGTASVLLASSNTGIKKVILASTVWVYNAVDKPKNLNSGIVILNEDSPISPSCGNHFYTTSKLTSEFLCHDFNFFKNLKFTILRYGIPYGPRMWKGLVLRAFTENAMAGKPLTITGDGSAKRRFVHIDDLASAHVLALSEKADNEIFNLEGDADVTIKELAELVSKNIDNTKVEFIIDESRKGELSTDNIEISNKKAKEVLGWKVNVDIKQGVKSYIDWHKNSN